MTVIIRSTKYSKRKNTQTKPPYLVGLPTKWEEDKLVSELRDFIQQWVWPEDLQHKHHLRACRNANTQIPTPESGPLAVG